MSAVAVRTYLELRDPADLRARRVDDESVRVERVEHCDPSFWRSLYEGVGTPYHWVDRLPWTDAEIIGYLSDPAVSLYVLCADCAVAGYFELKSHDDGSVEIAYFGLLPDYYGRGLGAHLLTEAAERAWDLKPRRVWLHTSTLDHPAALSNYKARGFTIVRSEQYAVRSL